MPNIPTQMLVVAIALRDASGRFLLQKRPAHKHHGGLWEFPGGKVKSEESPRFALVREIAEELNLEIDEGDLTAALAADEGPAGHIVLIVYTCAKWKGEPEPLEGQEWGWFSHEQAGKLPMPPMDISLLDRLPF